MLRSKKPAAKAASLLPRIVLPRNDVVLYAVGDVHGMLDPLLAIENRIIRDGERFDCPKIVVMLGDYVDRGRDSARVLEHLIQPMPDGFRRVCLRGNHEAAMLSFLRAPQRGLGWLEIGGEATLSSYGLDIRQLMRSGGLGSREAASIIESVVPEHHRAFLQSLPVMAVGGDMVFVHAGIRPGVALPKQRDRDLLMIREPFLTEGPRLPVTVVHGHTPSIVPVKLGNRICLDTFAYSTGRLAALRVRGNRGAFLHAP